MSERRACRLLGLDRSSCRYRPKPKLDEELCARLRELAAQHPRYGYRRLGALLKREGRGVNHKKVERLYREQGLAVRRRRRKRLAPGARASAPAAERANQLWSLDFVSDTTAQGRVLRLLTVVDAYTRECLAIEADTSLTARRVTAALERVLDDRPSPGKIRTDNGPEFRSRWFRSWCEAKGIRLDYIEPGKPAERHHRKLQRPSARRMPERQLVPQPAPRATCRRCLAQPLQSTASPQRPRLQDA
jgi:putative transposase